MKAKAVAPAKKKKKIQVQKGTVFVKSSYNNTIISISDQAGNVLSWSSPGVIGFTGSKKSTAYAATRAAEDAVEKAQKYGLKEANVIIKGTGLGRQAAVKGLRSAGLRISTLSDHTPIPHGGTVPRKKPRGS
ncbi:MAG: 30S ribosomal protein S11 [Candidatus Dojkabacteria bacterium]|uniref:Small ribosomal subunit protein uS11 n=1 Tax=Candidatus Dojkabacteria bacterium TaxID=2099670 RepID=A0A952AKC3_9BACT|nr:30S ribosomal protein S11 [Candidatus Dojkabacteria bacterium]WKZ28492.1 MAG: 30S ribosomal protein S11 [Candidatus Dojkabacteria bacterium]